MVTLKKFVEDTLKWMEDEHTTEEFEEKLKELNSTFQPMKYMSDEEKAEAMKGMGGMPAGFKMPEGMQMPEGMDMPEGMAQAPGPKIEEVD
jgi:hypothetical protein